MIKDHQLEFFDDSENVDIIQKSLIATNTRAIDHEHMMGIQQRLLELHALMKLNTEQAREWEQSEDEVRKMKQQVISKIRGNNMKALVEFLFFVNNHQSCDS